MIVSISLIGAPCSGVWLLSMLGKSQSTPSKLDLVKSEAFDSSDEYDKITMADLVESLDARELDLEEGDDLDYDGNYLGMYP